MVAHRLTGTFNLSAGESHTVREVIALVEKHTEKKIELRLQPAPAWDVQHSRLDPAQLLSLIGGGTQGQGGTSRTGSLASAASALAGSLLGGSGSAPVPSGGGAAALLSGPIGGILQGQATTFIETLKKSVREIRLTVSWSDGKDRRSVSASQIVVILPQGVVPNPALQNTVSPQGGQQVTPRSTQP